MPHLTAFRCIHCGRDYPPDSVSYTCPVCSDSDGLFDIVLDVEAVRRQVSRDSLAAGSDRTIRRWLPLLPVDGRLPPLDIGGTPCYDVPSLAELAGVAEVRVKDDGRNPTASFKDRASAVVIARALEMGAPLITTASTGNAASSLAGLSAAAGLDTVIFVPRSAPQAKITQLLIYGASVVTVDGTYDDAFDLCLAATREFGWYNRNTGYNPYTIEGKKTAALELAEQYGWDVPDLVLVPTGDGCILAGVYKGFADLLALGWIDRIPRLVAVQAQGSNAIAQAFHGGAAHIPSAQTIADSISVSQPRVALHALRALRESKGDTVLVSDEEILAAMRLLARHAGVFAEPAGCAALAGLLAMHEQKRLSGNERVALLITGNGLKDVASAMKAADRVPFEMARGDVEALRRHGSQLNASATKVNPPRQAARS